MVAAHFIYETTPGDTAEVDRVLRILLCGSRIPEKLNYRVGEFHAWVGRVFFPIIAPHALAVLAAGERRDGDSIILADATILLGKNSRMAGQAVLSHRAGAVPHPVLRRFSHALTSGRAAGNFSTVMALHALDFSIAPLSLLTALLYCEWATAQAPHALRDTATFQAACGKSLHDLPALLTEKFSAASGSVVNSPRLQHSGPRR